MIALLAITRHDERIVAQGAACGKTFRYRSREPVDRLDGCQKA